MFLIADRRKKLGFVENTQEFRDLTDKIEEGGESLDFLSCRVRRTGALADKAPHIKPDFGQQLIEQFLAIFEMIIKRSLRDVGLLGNAGNGCFGITVLADDLGG